MESVWVDFGYLEFNSNEKDPIRDWRCPVCKDIYTLHDLVDSVATWSGIKFSICPKEECKTILFFRGVYLPSSGEFLKR